MRNGKTRSWTLSRGRYHVASRHRASRRTPSAGTRTWRRRFQVEWTAEEGAALRTDTMGAIAKYVRAFGKVHGEWWKYAMGIGVRKPESRLWHLEGQAEDAGHVRFWRAVQRQGRPARGTVSHGGTVSRLRLGGPIHQVAWQGRAGNPDNQPGRIAPRCTPV